ncbi:MAG: ribonuclease H-like domain-containing protein, partial [Trichodesmium sp. St7_bin2_1]|nr:ribonuclease H-like domain-containing protein [Trichodesmium sp. St7_bin2_1]
MRDVQIESNHLVAFCDDTGLRYDPDGKVSTHEIYKRLQEWYVETGVVEYDEMNRQVWYPNKSRRDFNIKGLPPVKRRIASLFPKATITQSRTSSSRLTVFNGICFHSPDEVVMPSEPDLQTIMKTENITTQNLSQPVPVGVKESPPVENTDVKSTSIELDYVEHSSKVEDTEKEAIADIDVDKIQLLAPAEETVKYNPYQFAEIEKVKGKPTVVVDEEKIDIYNIPTPKRPIDFKPFKIPEYNELKLIYMDIETTGLNPEESEIISVGLMREENGNTENLIISRKDFDERSLISKTIETLNILCKNGYSVLVGHNIFNFDLPFIASRAEKYGINVPYDIVKERFTNISSASMFGKPIQFHNIVWRGYKKLNIIDTMHQLGIYDKSANKLTNYKLKPSVIQLKLREEQRTELSYEEIMESYKTSNWQLIDEYLVYDLEDTKLLTDFLLPQVYYQLQIVPGL